MVAFIIFHHVHSYKHHLHHFKYCGKIKGRFNLSGGLIGPLNGD
jgi:hypothetical protein